MGKLIVIDDDQLFHRIFRLMSYKLKVFTSASYYSEAGTILQYLKENKANADRLPDVLLIDLYMPGLSGWEFLEGLQEFYDRISKPIAVYVTSVSVIAEDRRRAEQFPFVKEYLLKPITPPQLMAIYQDVNREQLCV